MEFMKQTTTEWKRENGLRSINFCVPIPLLRELDYLKHTTGTTRSEMIRAGIRMYIREQKNKLAEQERNALERISAKRFFLYPHTIPHT